MCSKSSIVLEAQALRRCASSRSRWTAEANVVITVIINFILLSDEVGYRVNKLPKDKVLILRNWNDFED